MSTSSIVQTVPISPAKASDIHFWKCSGADDIPKGNRLNQYRQNGVIKVVRREDAGSRGICQNPKLASSFVNSFVPANCA